MIDGWMSAPPLVSDGVHDCLSCEERFRTYKHIKATKQQYMSIFSIYRIYSCSHSFWLLYNIKLFNWDVDCMSP